MHGLISVIVPVYNVELYLVNCVESIITQSYNNLEIILVDDGSVDKCREICDRYAIKDSRIKVIHKENGGLSDARNAGLEVCTGDFISFVDADDYIQKDFYQVLIELIIKNNADIAQCGYSEVNQYEITEIKDEKLFEVIKITSKADILDRLYGKNKVGVNWVVWNKLYKKKLLHNITFPKDKLHEDVFTTYKIMYNAENMVLTTRNLYFYLIRPSSIMGQEMNIKRLDLLDAFKNQMDFYNDKELFDLRDQVIKVLEVNIRSLISKVINAELKNEEKMLNSILFFYKEHFELFTNLDNNFKQRVVRFLYIAYPKQLIKWKRKLF